MNRRVAAAAASALALGCATVDMNCPDKVRGIVLGDAKAQCVGSQARLEGGSMSAGGWAAVGIFARAISCRITFGVLC